jgi:alkyl hydroperoxide reductase subunit AhpC
MLDQTHLDQTGLPLTVRSVYFIGPDKKIKLILTYPASTGRNFAEIIRCIDSLKLAAEKKGTFIIVARVRLCCHNRFIDISSVHVI